MTALGEYQNIIGRSRRPCWELKAETCTEDSGVKVGHKAILNMVTQEVWQSRDGVQNLQLCLPYLVLIPFFSRTAWKIWRSPFARSTYCTMALGLLAGEGPALPPCSNVCWGVLTIPASSPMNPLPPR